MKRYQNYIWAVFIYILALGSYVYYGYESEKTALYESLNQELLQGAKALPVLLENSFHGKLLDAQSVSEQEDMQNIKKLSDYTKLTRLIYIYSFVLDGDTVRFASSSATPKELEKNEGLSHYFDVYESATEKLKEAFSKQEIYYENITDKWGTFRSVFIPLKTENGKVFVTCADIRIDFIETKLNEIVFYSILEALFYISILFPFFIAFWLVNKKINRQLEETITIRTAELAKSQEQMSILLDNAEQGFLSFSNDLIINQEYSKACIKLLGDEIGGKNIADILFGDTDNKHLFITTIHDALEQEDAISRDAILSLLPSEIIFNKRALKIEYKLISNTKFMLIITNITANKKLENRIKKEQEILKMIVEVVSDSEIFFDTKREYENFITFPQNYVDTAKTPLCNFNEIYRMIHTFKGAFSQLYMQQVVKFLHELESKISLIIKENRTSNDLLLEILKQSDFKSSFQNELQVVENILGEEFFKETNYIKVNFDSLHELQIRVATLMSQDEQNVMKYKDVFDKILGLSKMRLINLLKPYNNLVNHLSQRLHKEIYDFEVIGDGSIMVTEGYKPFIKSLVHVFRNCIDHGIEDAEMRVAHEKDEIGTISCSFKTSEDTLVLVISDDGAGINKRLVVQKAIEKNLITEYEATLLSEEEVYNFIFSTEFSTKEEVSEISGRGVGMSAVQAELVALGGTLEIRSKEGVGTTLIFTLPYKEVSWL